MDFALSEQQELLRNSARDFLDKECPKSLVRKLEASESGYSPELWKKMAGLGWLGLALPETYGGFGSSLVDLSIILQELGRAACPSPLFSTVVLGALPILDAGTEAQKNEILPKVANGEVILTMALSEPEVDYNPKFIATRAVSGQGGFKISGTKLFVQNAHLANRILVVAKTGSTGKTAAGISVFLIDGKSKGLSLSPLTTVAGDKQSEVKLEKVSAAQTDILGAQDKGSSVVDSAVRRAAALACSETVGVMERALEMATAYVKTRVQFGQPIGAFQSIQHRLADMLMVIEGARWATYQALWRLDNGMPAAREVAIAQAWVSDASQKVAFGAQQVHGGLGVDMDYDLQFYFRRAKSLELNFGSAPVHKRALEVEMGL